MGIREIRLCEEGSEGNPEIRICPDEDSDEGKEIRICPGDCNDPPELELTGEDAPSVGDVYTASGGEGVYHYSFDGGTISKSGEILSITSCGGSQNNGAVGSVTVTDSCGQSKSITVRLPGGSWQNNTKVYECPSTGFTPGNATVVVVSGATRRTYHSGNSVNIKAMYTDCYLPTDSSASCPGCRLVEDGCRYYVDLGCIDFPNDTLYGPYTNTETCCPGGGAVPTEEEYYPLATKYIYEETWEC